MLLTILYASQTGKCEKISLDIFQEAVKRGIQVERYGLDKSMGTFDFWNQSSDRIYVFVVSSTGDGMIPDNGDRFYEKIQETAQSEDEGTGSEIKFTILGMGDSFYQKY